MKYYKVIKNRKVIDVLDNLTFVKYQMKNKILLLCSEEEAEGVLSSDRMTAYHTSFCRQFPVNIYSNVTLEEIEKEEYDRLVTLHLKTAEEIIDEVMLEMLERGVF